MQNNCRSTAWKAGTPEIALRELARARRNQLDLALRGHVLASVAYAERARRIRRALARQPAT